MAREQLTDGLEEEHPHRRRRPRIALALLVLAMAIGAVVAVVGQGASVPASGGSVAGSDSGSGSGEASSSGRQLFVALDGRDDADGSVRRPFRTVRRATAAARPGDTVHVRGGVYRRERVLVDAEGRPGAPIVVRPHPGERVVFDGEADVESGANRWFDWDALVTIQGAHLVFEGFEVRNSPGLGVFVRDGRQVTVRRNRVHHTWWNAIALTGDHLTAERNVVHHASMNNLDGSRRGSFDGWAGGISSNTTVGGRRSTNIRWVRNRIHHTWGECLGVLHVDDYQVVGNDVHDCWSANIYLDNTRNGIVERNRSHRTDDTMAARPGRALAWGNEPYEVGEQSPTENVLVRDNVFSNADAVAFIRLGCRSYDTYRNVRFVRNRLENTGFFVVETCTVAPEDNAALHNSFGGDVEVAQPEAWTLRGNEHASGTRVDVE